MTDTKYIRARGCGFTVPEGDEGIIKLHESMCPKCQDIAAIRRQLKLERARKKKEE